MSNTETKGNKMNKIENCDICQVPMDAITHGEQAGVCLDCAPAYWEEEDRMARLFMASLD
jgi:hypothetical protein